MEQLILVIVIGLVGLVKWIIENREQFSGSKTERSSRERPAQKPEESLRPAPSAETPEEERMRRFMEALGLPSDSAPPTVNRRGTPPQAAPPLPRVEQSIPEPQIPPPVVHPRPSVEPKRWGHYPEPARESKKPQTAPLPRRAAMPTPKPIGVPAPMPTPKRVAPAAHSTSAAPFSPLEAFPEIPDAAPTSIAAPPMEVASLELVATSSDSSRSTKITDLRGELRDPAALRRAFVIREILGRPLAMKS